MHIVISLVLLATAVIAVAGVAARLDVSAPLLLVTVGAAASFVPFVPEVQLSSEVVLVGLLPPLLYNAALGSSLVDFNTHRRSILLLSVGLVAATATVVAVVVHLIIPTLNWPAAFAIGAVVSPPDAVAATSIARRIGMPRRIVTILEGESLLNDATALVALRTAIIAGSAAGALSTGRVAVDFLVAAGGGVLVGVLLYVVVGGVRRRITDPVFDTSISFVTPFAAYVCAEQVDASGVIAVVVAGLLLGHRSPVLQTASSRIAERLNWRTISFLLENGVFLLIGLQARWIIDDVANSHVRTPVIVGACVAALGSVVVIRIVWVFATRYVVYNRFENGVAIPRPPWTYTAVLGWAGMRGVVTLAAAFAIPKDFPDREVLILIALVVAAGTLFLQGASLPWLVRRLDVPGPDPREDALARAVLFQKATTAGLTALEEQEDGQAPPDVVATLRQRAEQRDFAAWEQLGSKGPETETPSESYARLRLEMLQKERSRVLAIRDSGQVPQDVVSDVLNALDVEESMLDLRSRRSEGLREAWGNDPTAIIGHPAPCAHLDEAPEDVEPQVRDACEDCLVEGTSWVHLRLCLACGHMGCCDSSVGRHATRHFEESEHPVMRSAEPGEAWRWCYVDERLG